MLQAKSRIDQHRFAHKQPHAALEGLGTLQQTLDIRRQEGDAELRARSFGQPTPFRATGSAQIEKRGQTIGRSPRDVPA